MSFKKLNSIIVALIVVVLSNPVIGNTFPNKPITVITSFPVGSGPDGYGRPLVKELSSILKVPVILENRPGGGGVVSLSAFNNEPANGYHVYFTDPAVINNYVTIYKQDDLVKNIKMLVPGTMTDLVLITAPSITSARDLANAIQKNPHYGAYALGSPGHMYSIQLGNQLNITSELILYKDYGQWLLDISTQRLPYSFITMASGQALEKANKVKFLAITATSRDPAYPDVPTVDELFGKKLRLEAPATGSAFYIKKNVPAEDIKILRDAFQQAFSAPSVKEALESRRYNRWAPSAQGDNIDEVMNKDAQLTRKLLKQFNIDLKQ